MPEKRLKARVEYLLCSAPTEYKDRDCKKVATYVCHHCGAPLCEQCVKITNDPKFVWFENAWNIFLSALAIIIVPIIIGSMLPMEWGLPVAISGVIIGVTMLITLHIQPKFTPVKKIYQKAAHCKKCFSAHRVQSIIDKMLLTFGVLLVIYGMYKFVEGTGAIFLILAAVGVAIMLVKKDIVYSELSEKLFRSKIKLLQGF